MRSKATLKQYRIRTLGFRTSCPNFGMGYGHRRTLALADSFCPASQRGDRKGLLQKKKNQASSSSSIRLQDRTGPETAQPWRKSRTALWSTAQSFNGFPQCRENGKSRRCEKWAPERYDWKEDLNFQTHVVAWGSLRWGRDLEIHKGATMSSSSGLFIPVADWKQPSLRSAWLSPFPGLFRM